MRNYKAILILLLVTGAFLFWREYRPGNTKTPPLDINVSKDQIKPLLSRVQDLKLQRVYYPLIAKKLLAEKGICPEEGLLCGEAALQDLDEQSLYTQYGRTTLLIARGDYDKALEANELLKIDLEKRNPRPSCLYVLTLLRKAALLSQQKKSLNEVKKDFASLNATELELLEKVCDSEGLAFQKLQDFVASNQ